MTIKHLVISGGGPILIQILSAIQELEKNDFLHLSEIESIYGTSAGALIGVILSLHFDWETINDYIIKRPWQDVFPIKVQNILEAYAKKGIFDNKTVEKCFKPLFLAKDISLQITMEEFFILTKVDLHMYSFEVNSYALHDISHSTHPDLPLLTAVQMTCAIPVLLTPVVIEDKCFMDGGIACNYPLHFCVNSGKSVDEILGFKNKYSDNKSHINEESTLLDYILGFLFKAIFNVNTLYTQPQIKHEVICDASYLTFDILRNALSQIEIRKELFEKGKLSATQFLS